jgi:hypothetical protein
MSRPVYRLRAGGHTIAPNAQFPGSIVKGTIYTRAFKDSGNGPTTGTHGATRVDQVNVNIVVCLGSRLRPPEGSHLYERRSASIYGKFCFEFAVELFQP